MSIFTGTIEGLAPYVRLIDNFEGWVGVDQFEKRSSGDDALDTHISGVQCGRLGQRVDVCAADQQIPVRAI